jgi:UDP-2,3-diacylglucosamine pyrophosphatase LpxH
MGGRVLADDTLVVFISDVHIGGAGGSEIFESAAELAELLDEIGGVDGPVELVLAGDFLDLQRMGEPDAAADLVAATLARPEYRDLFDALRRFRRAPGHRVTYVMGNHDSAAWWDAGVQGVLTDAGLVDEFALSYAASFDALPGQVIYCEHGNQFDPSNRITDYADPLDTPLGAHVVNDVVRPIGAGVRVVGSVDLRDMSYVFPLAGIPEWMAGRIFYRFFDEAVRWLAVLFGAHMVILATATVIRAGGTTLRTLWTITAEVAYDVGLLIAVLVVLYLVSRRAAGRVISFVGARLRSAASGSEPARIRAFVLAGGRPPLSDAVTNEEIAVFVSAHTHSPSMTHLVRADGRKVVIVNTGCWLRQFQPVPARLGAPPVFVPTFVLTHVRVHCGADDVTVELWSRPKPAERRLSWTQRVAIAGRIPEQAPPDSRPQLVDREAVSRWTARSTTDPA